MEISTIGIDIGKNGVHVVGFDARGGILLRARSRAFHAHPGFAHEGSPQMSAIDSIDRRMGRKTRGRVRQAIADHPALSFSVLAIGVTWIGDIAAILAFGSITPGLLLEFVVLIGAAFLSPVSPTAVPESATCSPAWSAGASAGVGTSQPSSGCPC